jgi:Na+-driven multidrug efflux pump
MVAVVAPLFTVIGVGVWFVAPRMGLAVEVWTAFRIYGTVLIGGSAFTTFWSIIPDSLIKAHQDTRSTMWAGIWTNLINVGLNTLFLFVFHWGIFGIALSTVLGRIGGLVYALGRARHHERRRRELDETPGTDSERHPYLAILRLAVPSSLTFTLIAVEAALVNYLLSKLDHATAAIAAYSIYYRVVLFGLQPVIATAVAMLPYAARLFGAGDVSGVRRGLRDATVSSVLYSVVVLGPVMFIAGPWIAERLSESQETLRYASFALRMAPLACLTGSPFLLCRPVFEAMNRGKPGLWMAAFRYLVLTGPLAWAGLVLARRSGLPPLYGMIIGLLVTAAVTSAVFFAWVRAALRQEAGVVSTRG